MLHKVSATAWEVSLNIASKHTIRNVSRFVEPTLPRLRALKKQILNVSKSIQIKVAKDF